MGMFLKVKKKLFCTPSQKLCGSLSRPSPARAARRKGNLDALAGRIRLLGRGRLLLREHAEGAASELVVAT